MRPSVNKLPKHLNVPSGSVNTAIICPDCNKEILFDKVLDKFFCYQCKKLYEIALIEVDDISGAYH